MMRVLFTGLVLCLLTGCAMFPQAASPSQSIHQVSASELRSLVPGQWVRVRLHDVQQKGSETGTEHIGRLQSADGESITLTDVTTRRRYTSPPPFLRVPYLSRLYKNTGIGNEDNPNPLTVPRDQMESIDSISPAEAAELKQPFERIGVDFDCGGEANYEGRTAVMSLEKR